jgi:hypothetical protein
VATETAWLDLTAVVVCVTEDEPWVVTVAPAGVTALPTGAVQPGERTLEIGVRRLVRELAGVSLGYVEQLYTFGDIGRSAGSETTEQETRQVAVAYLALGPRHALASGAEWRSLYGFMPWEDRRGGGRHWPELAASVERWCAAGPDGQHSPRALRRERADIAFGLGGAPWDEERTLDRFELLYELGMVETVPDVAAGQRAGAGAYTGARAGMSGALMAGDHRRILAAALGRIRGKIKYRPVIFELVPDTFTMNELQRVAEALAGIRLHTANFRRLVANTGLVEPTGSRTRTGGRPAELFRFRREVLRERTAPGVAL